MTERLILSLATSFNNSHYTKIPALTYSYYPNGFPGPTVTMPDLSINSPLNQAPDDKVSFSARYTLPVTDSSRLIASASATYTSSQSSQVTISETYKLPAYTIMSMRLQYDFGGDKYSAAFFVTNLTNEYYYTGGVHFGYYFTGAPELDPARPREFGGEVTVHF